ncbi:MAG: succinyldiaminopimelate transaminase [Bermanella sp.]
MNPNLSKLQPYPFEKLAKLKADASISTDLAHISLSIGEPKHQSPSFVKQAMIDHLDKLANYPTTKGLPELRHAIANWCQSRFHLSQLDAETQVLPVNGTREAIFSFAQAMVAPGKDALITSPNPFYQIYEGAAYLAGARPHYLPCLQENGFKPDFKAVSADVWRDTQILFICSPGNPTGAVIDIDELTYLIALADQYDFILASDECYSEIYVDAARPPVGLLEACQQLGRTDYRRCVVFHSLSKRSNLPGLRSGFVAGDAQLLSQFFQYRTYHGCAMSIPNQLASIVAWGDEAHVQENRRLYSQKFQAVLEILSPVMDVSQSDASFYLWAKTPINEEEFTQRLFAEQQVTVLPGSYLSRTIDGINPGENRIRLALVAEVDECIEAARRIRSLVESL